MKIIARRKMWYTFSATLTIVSLAAFLFWGLRPGIDFTGGSLLELEFLIQRPAVTEVTATLEPLDLGSITIQPIGESGFLFRLKNIDEETHQKIISQLKERFKQSVSGGEGITMELSVLEEKRFDSIGPSLGQELQQKTFVAIAIVVVTIILYIAWAFRKVSRPVASWKYGVIAVVALVHNIAITVGVFVIMGRLYGLEVNAPFVAALLTILGYSVNDTIVIFDRTRENLTRSVGVEFADVVEASVHQSMTRSINTGFSALMVLFAILLFGGSAIRDFVLALIIGISFGTYSSIFLASPLLVTWQRFSKNS